MATVGWQASDTISVVALVVSAGSVAFAMWTWRHERRDRRAERQADREEAARQRGDVFVEVRLVYDPGTDFTDYPLRPSWWRLTLSGGSPFSRAIVGRFIYLVGDGRDDNPAEVLATGGVPPGWRSVLDDATPHVRLSHGQTVHLAAPLHVDDVRFPLPVALRWTAGGQERQALWRLFPEPWG